MDYIQDNNNRNIAFCKRKRGLIKKAMEISKLCGTEVFLVVLDSQKQRLLKYSSCDEFSAKVVDKIITRENTSKFKYESYTNEHYNYFEKNGKPDPSIDFIDNFEL